MEFSVILLSGGKGIRFGNKTPKQYLMIAGKPMIMHSLENIDRCENVKEIVVVCNEKYICQIKNYIDKYNIHTNVVFANAGDTRQRSVYNGLLSAHCERVIIHEAARPFVCTEDYNRLIDCEYNNVSYTCSIPYTVLKKNNENFISDILERNELVNIQLPQKFVRADLILAHELAEKDKRLFTEDASLLKFYLNKNIYCLEGKSSNIKITEYIDFLIGETLYKEEFVKEN